MTKVVLVHAPDLEKLFPGKRPARVILEMKGGAWHQDEVHLVAGDPESPLTWDELTAKFHNCTTPFLSKNIREKIVDSVRSLEKMNVIGDLTEYLRVPVSTRL